MPVDHSGGNAGDGHAKHILYDEVYDPLTRAWFTALAGAEPRIDQLLGEITTDLIGGFQRFDELWHALVDECLVDLPDRDRILSIVRVHRDSVQWCGYMVPDEHATPEELLGSLAAKLKRNISLAVVESLICLESAYRYGQELGVYGWELESLLRRSRHLYQSLAALHDEQEAERLTYLTGREGHLAYPDVDYEHVLRGKITINLDRFVRPPKVDAATDQGRLRFQTPPVTPSQKFDSPTKRCPAHRLAHQDTGESYNDALWDLLIRIYQAAGRFD